MRRPAFLIPLLLVLALFFGWKTWGALSSPVDAGKPEAAEAPPLYVEAAGMGLPQPGNLAPAVSSILARPVFRPDRLPFPEDSNTDLSRREFEKELGRYTLHGVMLLEGMQVALVTGKAAGGTERFEVGPGDSLPGFTVKEIREDGVLLVADGREFLLPLYVGSPKGQVGGVRTEVTRPAAVQPSSTVTPASPSTPSPFAGAAPAPSGADAVRAMRPPDRFQQRGKRTYPSRDRSSITQQSRTPGRTPVPFRGNARSPFNPAN